MKRATALLCVTLLLAGCGAQDYGPEDRPTRLDVSIPTEPTVVPGENSRAPLLQRRLAPGYLWRGLLWVGVPDARVENLKCHLRDGSQVNRFQAFGTALVGGAVLGLIIRGSGSWFFGGPAEGRPDHWFFKKIDETMQSAGRGVVRGALFAGACETLLAGGNLTPLSGILGQDFLALSSALAVGGLAAIAATPFAQRAVEKDLITPPPPPKRTRRKTPAPPPDDNERGSRATILKLQEWSRTSELGQMLRFRVAPGVIILGVGAGVGLLVYDGLQGDTSDSSACPDANH